MRRLIDWCVPDDALRINLNEMYWRMPLRKLLSLYETGNGP